MKIGIFDDHPMMGSGIAELIKKKFAGSEIVFVSNNRTDLFAKIKEIIPDIIILDIIVPDVTGLEIFEKISSDFPAIKMIAHTALTSPVLVENLLSMNVRGFINKRQSESEMMDAVRRISEGEIYVPDDYKYLVKNKGQHTETNFLSERETEIMNLIAQESTSSEIAEKLNISVNTVENHRKNIFRKLKVKNAAGMVMEAARLGYLS